MAQYIDKDAALAEIENRIKSANNDVKIGAIESLIISKTLNGFKSFLNTLEVKEVQKEPVSERFAFKAIPRLLEMIEPTDRAKAYTAKLADAFEVEGYSTDAKIVRESIKVMNGDKVPLATMDDEPVSEDLKEAYERYVDERMVLLRPDIADMSCDRDTKMSFDIFDGSEVEAAFYEGALWQKQQLMKDAVVMEAHEEYGELWGDITKCSTEKGKKYKVIILKMEGLL